MKQITVLSGKGGTGKTSLVASFAALAQKIVVTDCDVDAPDLHLLLKPEIIQTQEFTGSKLAVIDEGKCTQCGKCGESCRFNAIHDFTVDPILCEGCGVCAYVCPVEAVTLTDRVAGYAYISKTKYGSMSHALLNPGGENSGKLVSLVRQNARQIAENEAYTLILNDGPPGIGCPVIAALSGIDVGLVVVEPTLSGVHDMKRALALLNHFHTPALVCINKYDVNRKNTCQIVTFCRSHGLEVVGKVPFDSRFTQAMVAGKPLVEHAPKSVVANEISELWSRILKHLEMK